MVSSISPIKAEKCCILFVNFDRRGKIIFIKDLVEIVVILPNLALFCISGNIPVNLNYSWLKIVCLVGNKRRNHLKTTRGSSYIWPKKGQFVGPETNRNEIILGLSFSKTEGKYKTSIFCFLTFLYKQKTLGKLSQPKISCDFFLI